MDRREWKRHEERKAKRLAASQQQPELLSRVATYRFDQAELRAAEFDVREPFSHVVRHLAAGLIAGTSPLALIRTLAFSNWDTDDRHLIEIPEARAFCWKLWVEGKQLLRFLIESTHDTPLDDRPGVTQDELVRMGLGWWEVYCIAKNKPEWLVPNWAMQNTEDIATLIAARDDARRKAHDELFHGLDRGPFGYTPEAAAERTRLVATLSQPIAALMLVREEGHFQGNTILVLSLADEQAGMLANRLKEADRGGTIPWCSATGVDKSVSELCLLPGEQAATAIAGFAPEVAAAVKTENLSHDEYWVIVVASGGTQASKARR